MFWGNRRPCRNLKEKNESGHFIKSNILTDCQCQPISMFLERTPKTCESNANENVVLYTFWGCFPHFRALGMKCKADVCKSMDIEIISVVKACEIYRI